MEHITCSGTAENRLNESFKVTVQADDKGQVSFACLAVTITDYLHILSFENTENNSDVKTVNLGRKTLEAKVYNVTRDAK